MSRVQWYIKPIDMFCCSENGVMTGTIFIISSVMRLLLESSYFRTPKPSILCNVLYKSQLPNVSYLVQSPHLNFL